MIADVPVLDDLRKLVRADPRNDYEIARAAKIHPTTFSSFMNRNRSLGLKPAERLAEALGAPLKPTKRKGGAK